MRRRKKLVRFSLTIGFALLYIAAHKQGYVQQLTQSAQQNQPGLYRVSSFTDGDTIVVDMDGVNEPIRFIGVDTPETHDPRKSVQCFGQAAASFTRQFIGANRVRLERDPDTSNRDKYNRLLRYVYLQNGQLVNAEIIKQGYGFAYVYFPFTKMEAFKTYQKSAETQSLGLWGKCPVQTNTAGQSSTN